MTSLTILFVFVAFLNTVLIYFHHFSPFEKESNLRAIRWGAPITPRYRLVLGLEACIGLLTWLLVLGLWPQSADEDALVRLVRLTPLWMLLTLLVAAFHHLVNDTIIRFPNYKLIAQRTLVISGVGAVVCIALSFVACAAFTPDFATAVDWWMSALPATLFPGLFYGFFAFLTRAVAFNLRVVPIIGDFLHASASLAGLLWATTNFGRFVNDLLQARAVFLKWHGLVDEPLTFGFRGYSFSLPGGEWIPAVVISVFALAILRQLWRIRADDPAPEAQLPPPLVVSEPARVNVAVDLQGNGATLTSAKLRVEVRRNPFALSVKTLQGQMLWELAPRGLTRDWLLQKFISIPILYTGNTMKFKWRLWAQALTQVASIQRTGAGGRGLGKFSDLGSSRSQRSDSQSRIALQAGGNALLVSFRSATMRLSFHSDDVLRLEVFPSTTPLTPISPLSPESPESPLAALFPSAFSIALNTYPDAHFLGTGQRFNKIDQRGEEPYCFIEEGGVGYAQLAPILKFIFGERGSFPNGEYCTGFPVPFALLAREQGPTTGLFWNTYQPSWIKFPSLKPSPLTALRGGRNEVRLTVLDDHLDVYLCAGPTPLEAMQQYTALTGRSDVPPVWALLPWKTRTGAVTQDDTFEDMQQFRALQIPLAQVGIEHWQDVRGSYEFSQNWWPEIDRLIATAHTNGYRVHIWHFPYMNAGAATHHEGVQQGYFLRNRLGLPYQQRIFHGIACVVDYSNPFAAEWHGNIVQRTFHERGIHAVMTDYAESVPPDCVFLNGQSGLQMRNAYPVMYCAAMKRAASATLGDDHLLYPRAGYAGTQRYVAAQWPGDQDTDWDEGDGLPAAVRAMLNASICGFPIHGSDVGGWYDWFAPITTKELFVRWAEVGAYSPLMRAHGGPIGRNREPWKFDEQTVQIYRALSEEHVKMFPYWFSLAHEAARTGVPPIRHPALIWPACAELYAIEDAWLIGDALYVAPIIRPDVTRREVFIPPGEWWDLQQKCALTGPLRITVESPLGQTPLFLRRGFMLPRFLEAFDSFDAVVKGPGAKGQRTGDGGQAVGDEEPKVSDISSASSFRPPAPKVGRLDGDLEIWLYPLADGVATFNLFDGTELRTRWERGQMVEGYTGQVVGRKVGWRVVGG